MSNSLQSEYTIEIQRQRQEMIERKRRHEKERLKHARTELDFSHYCNKVHNAREYFKKAYEARSAMGLMPWTHAYDCPCKGNVWLAHSGFKTMGRYSANTDNVVFVPENADFDVIACYHTTVIDLRPEKLKDAWFIPAYSNTV